MRPWIEKPSLIVLACCAIAGCGSSNTPTPTPTTAIIALVQPASVAWSGLVSGSSCAAGMASDYQWTDTISETAGVQVTLSTYLQTVDGVPKAATVMSRSVAASGQATLSRELCFTNTLGHTVLSQYSGTDANGHAVSASNTLTLAARPITPSQVDRLVSAVSTAAQVVTNGLFDAVAALPTGGATIDITVPCEVSGSARSTGPVTSDLNNGTGTVSLTTTLTYSACTSNGIALDGGPLTTTGRTTFVATTVQNPIPFTITGSHRFTLDGIDGAVAFNCTNSMYLAPDLRISSLVATGNATVQYPAGQNPTTVSCQTFADAIVAAAAPSAGARGRLLGLAPLRR